MREIEKGSFLDKQRHVNPEIDKGLEMERIQHHTFKTDELFDKVSSFIDNLPNQGKKTELQLRDEGMAKAANELVDGEVQQVYQIIRDHIEGRPTDIPADEVLSTDLLVDIICQAFKQIPTATNSNPLFDVELEPKNLPDTNTLIALYTRRFEHLTTDSEQGT